MPSLLLGWRETSPHVLLPSLRTFNEKLPGNLRCFSFCSENECGMCRLGRCKLGRTWQNDRWSRSLANCNPCIGHSRTLLSASDGFRGSKRAAKGARKTERVLTSQLIKLSTGENRPIVPTLQTVTEHTQRVVVVGVIVGLWGSRSHPGS